MVFDVFRWFSGGSLVFSSACFYVGARPRAAKIWRMFEDPQSLVVSRYLKAYPKFMLLWGIPFKVGKVSFRVFHGLVSHEFRKFDGPEVNKSFLNSHCYGWLKTWICHNHNLRKIRICFQKKGLSSNAKHFEKNHQRKTKSKNT